MNSNRIGQWVVAVLLLFVTSNAAAQLRIIPQEKLDSVRSPKVVGSVPMHFKEGTMLNMGGIEEDGGVWTTEVQWTNVGQEPMVISRITSTCGCLKGDFLPRPVMPDSTATIRVRYNPKGHPGAVYQRLFVYTNSSKEHPSVILTLCGEVYGAPEVVDLYPASLGALRLRSTEVRFTAGAGLQQQTLLCLNGGSESLRLTTDTLLTSPALRIVCRPQRLAPGAKGEIVVKYDPSKAVFINPTMPLYIGGLRLAPRQRALTIHIGSAPKSE